MVRQLPQKHCPAGDRPPAATRDVEGAAPYAAKSSFNQSTNRKDKENHMKDLIARCGLDCEKCDARIATLNNDEALRQKTAKLWSEWNKVEIPAETISCMGCRTEGTKFYYCGHLCPIRKCAEEKGFATCGDCPELDGCEALAAITANNEEARRNLHEQG